MTAEAWRSLSLPAREAEVPALEAMLEALGALAVTVEALEDSPLFDHQDGRTPELWPECRVEALLDAHEDVETVLAALAAAGFDTAGAVQRLVADQDWQAAFRAHFAPLRFGDLWIVPSWHTAPPEAERVLHLDPGMAFGTGTHATTALCLEWLAKPGVVAGRALLDYGCGSGILAIAARLLGAARVSAVDIDPAACDTTRENAARNGVFDLAIASPRGLPPTTTRGGSFDLLIANLLLQPVLALRDEFAARLSSGGHIGLSGITVDQVPRVLDHYRPTFEMTAPVVRGEWALLAGRLRC